MIFWRRKLLTLTTLNFKILWRGAKNLTVPTPFFFPIWGRDWNLKVDQVRSRDVTSTRPYKEHLQSMVCTLCEQPQVELPIMARVKG